MKVLILFIICTAVDVVLSTIKSIMMVKSGKLLASSFSAISHGFYSYIIVLVSGDSIPVYCKMLITAICYFIGVYIVKFAEEKMRKDRMWKIEFTVPTSETEELDVCLKDVPHSYIKISDKHTLFNCYCSDKKQSIDVKEIISLFNAKWFVSEGQLLY